MPGNAMIVVPALKCDIVVVGAGISGLTAAHSLIKNSSGLSVQVLEASERVGGRTDTLSLECDKGMDQWDIGGQWVGKTQTPILELLQELEIDIYPQFTEGTKWYQFGDEKLRTYSSSLPTFSLLKALDFVQFLCMIERAIAKIDAENPFTGQRNCESLDSQSLQAYADHRVWTRTMADGLESATRVVFGAPPQRLSALYFMTYCRSGGSLLNLMEPEGDGAQGYRVSGGAGTIAQELAHRVGRENIHLDRRVEKITRVENAGGVELHIVGPEGVKSTIRALAVIVAIPPTQVARLTFEPALPGSLQELFNGYFMGNLFKFVVTYSRAFWRDKGFSGEISAACYTDSDRINPVQLTYDAVTDKGSPALIGFIHASWCGVGTDKERKKAVLHDLARYFGPEAKNSIDYVDRSWADVPFVGGCPVGLLGPGFMENFINWKNVDMAPIFWAGTETASHWMGYMSGAVEAGQRASSDVLTFLQPETGLTKDDKTKLKKECWVKPSRKYTKDSRAWFYIVPGLAVLGLCVLVWKKGVLNSPIDLRVVKSF